LKATLKKINEHIATLTEYGADIELVKGYGYFYFSVKPSSKALYDPESIHVCHLNHMSLEDWKKHVEWHIKEWEKNEYESH
jgi:hypothetical protein